MIITVRRRSLKKLGLQQDLNLWPPQYRCDALPTELWSHTLGARSIYWVHISREEWNDLKYIWNSPYNFWTVVVDKSEEWSLQLISNLSNWKEEIWKIRASTGFKAVTSTKLVQCSTNWAMKPHIGSIYWVHISLLTGWGRQSKWNAPHMPGVPLHRLNTERHITVLLISIANLKYVYLS